MEEEIYLIKPKRESLRGFFPELSGLYESFSGAFELCPPQQLFAPEKFALGYFVEMDNCTLVLSGSLYFTSNLENLANYQSGIDRRRLEITRRIFISPGDINEILLKSERYLDFRSNTNCGREAFSFRSLRNHQSDFVESLLEILNEAEVQ